MTFSVHTLHFIWKALTHTVSLSATFCMAADSEKSATAGIGQWGEDPQGSHRLETNWEGEGKIHVVLPLLRRWTAGPMATALASK